MYYPFVHFAGMELFAVLGGEWFMLEWQAGMQKEEPTSPLAVKSKSFEVKETEVWGSAPCLFCVHGQTHKCFATVAFLEGQEPLPAFYPHLSHSLDSLKGAI